MLHSNVLPIDNHVIYTWAYVTDEARIADTARVATDVGKIGWVTATNTFWVLVAASPIRWVAIASADNASTPSSVPNSVVSRDASGNFSVNMLTGALTGNASTASKWNTARTITVAGDSVGSITLDGSADVTLTLANTADSIELGVNTTGNYLAGVAVSGVGLSVSSTGEGVTQTITSNATSANVPSTIVARDANGNFSAGVITATEISGTFTGTVVGPVTGNASTASKWNTARTITVAGSSTGSVTLDGSADVTLTLTNTVNSIELGVDTTGSYVAAVSAGTGVTVTGGLGEAANPVISIGQAVAASDSPTFANITITGEITGNASTASKWKTPRTITVAGSSTGSVTLDGSANVTLTLTSTAAGISAGTGVTVTNGATSSTISIGQAVAASDSPTFANLTVGTVTASNVSISSSTSAGATLHLPHGSAPTSPINGDLWTTSGGMYGQINGVTELFASDATLRSYIDAKDYINKYPQAGLISGENEVPVYSDFKFALGAGGSSAFSVIDRDSKQVVYYVASTPTGKLSLFRAYRFSINDAYIFDNNPIAPAFLNAGEYVHHALNIGTFFAVLSLSSTTAPYTTTRTVIANTQGSSKSSDWLFVRDISSLLAGTCNFAVVTINGTERILRTTVSGSDTTLDVFDSNLTLLRTRRLMVGTTDIDLTDRTGAGRTGASIAVGYNPYGGAFPFTWNPFTETFHQKNSGYYTATTPDGVRVGVGYAVSISWSIPGLWLVSGTGILPANLIPLKTSTYRYNAYPDGTWDTTDGGMSTGYGAAGYAVSLTTDEYSGDLHMTVHGTWDYTNGGDVYILPYTPSVTYKTFGGSLTPSNGSSALLPDGSPWSKSITPNASLIIGDQISFVGGSNRYGSSLIYANFSTTQFSSVVTSNDTLKLDSASAVVGADSTLPALLRAAQSPGNFSTVVVAGTPTYCWMLPGQAIYTATASGVTRTWSPTSVIVPVIPATIGGITGLSYGQQIVWNGNAANPIIWALVKNATSHYIAKYAANSWSIPAGAVLQSELDAGNAGRGDTTYAGGASRSTSLLTENNRLIFEFYVLYVGYAMFYGVMYDTSNNTSTINQIPSPFNSKYGNGPGYYTYVSPYSGTAYGYNQYLGYYAISTAADYSSIRIVCSKDITGGGAAITEDQWFNNTATRYEMAITTESTVGLIAYLAAYPIFLGGYFTSIPTQSVTLTANAVNYIFATKSPANRTDIAITVRTTFLPNSFSRVCLGAVTTNATGVVSSVSYAHQGTGLPSQLNNANMVLMTDGKYPYWTDTLRPAAGADKGIRFPTDAYGGRGDTATITLEAASGESTRMTFRITNDTDDQFAFFAPSNSGMTLNGFPILNSNNYLSYTNLSDARLKTNVQTITDPLSINRALRGVYFDRIDTGESSAGVLGQETLPHMPMLVKSTDGILSVNYNGFSGLFIESIRALEDQIAELRAEIKKLKGM